MDETAREQKSFKCTMHDVDDKDCPFCLGGMTRADLIFGVTPIHPEYGERITRHWYGYCRTWFTNVAGNPPATGKIRIWDPLHKWEKS